MRIAYLGNFRPDHSTENHVRQGFEAIGVEVEQHQEDEIDWSTLAKRTADVAAVLWTTTNDYSPPRVYPEQRKFLRSCKVPTVGVHLDIWWDLAREHRIHEAPFFQCSLVCTADGGHDERWVDAGINHRWFPPGVSEFECIGGTFRPELHSPIAFVGSWDGSYHPESAHRAELTRYLSSEWGRQVQFWPKRGEHAVRGERLRDLYASVDILVGDSCFAGRLPRYFSDRLPETLGRGGFLIHPDVEGVTDGSLYTSGEHLATWPAGDWDALGKIVERYMDESIERRQIADAGKAHVLETATYTVRARQLLELLRTEGML